MIECEACGHNINAKTDDNYNRDHSMICCSKCDHCHPEYMEEEELNAFCSMGDILND